MPCLLYGELPELHCRSLRLSSDCKIGWFPAKINWEYDNWNKLQVFTSANSNNFIFTTPPPPPPPPLPFFSPGLLCPGQKIENERSGYNNGQKLPSFWPPRPPRALVSCADSEMLKKKGWISNDFKNSQSSRSRWPQRLQNQNDCWKETISRLSEKKQTKWLFSKGTVVSLRKMREVQLTGFSLINLVDKTETREHPLMNLLTSSNESRYFFHVVEVSEIKPRRF